jgi:peptidoglycan hydrolase-like amidase
VARIRDRLLAVLAAASALGLADPAAGLGLASPAAASEQQPVNRLQADDPAAASIVGGPGAGATPDGAVEGTAEPADESGGGRGASSGGGTATGTGGRTVFDAELAEAGGEATFHIEGSGWGHGVGMSQYGAYAMANAGFGAEAITAYYYRGTQVQAAAMPDGIRVYLGEFSGATGVFIQNPGAPYTYRTDNGLTTDVPANTRTVVALEGPLLRVWGPPHVAWPGATRVSIPLDGTNPVLVEQVGNRFRHGRIELIALPNGNILVIAAGLTMQQYLYGIAEVPSSWPAATLDAQALAARTYAFEKIQRLGIDRASCSCSLLGSQGDQVYVGFDKEGGFAGDRWRAAVDRTNGRIITYNGAPIQAFYSSSNGGHTEASEYAFVQALPYLQAFPDPYDAASPDRRWVRDYTQAQLTRWLGAAGDTAVGTVTRLEILGPLTPSGRVGRVLGPGSGGVRITGTAGVKQVSGGRFWTVVNNGVFGDGFGYDRSIKSTRFTIGGFPAADLSFRGGLSVSAGRFDRSGQDYVVVANGPGSPPIIRIYDAEAGLRQIFYAYEPAFQGGFNTATCDVDGDGLDEIVTIPGPGGGPLVLVYEWDSTLRSGFAAYEREWAGGNFVGCGDVDSDGIDEIVTGPDWGGGPLLRVFEADGTHVNSFAAAARDYILGIRPATVDPDGPGGRPAQIVVGGGAGGDPWVRLFDVWGNQQREWLAYEREFRGGVFVDGFDVAGDGAQEVITGPGWGGGPLVIVRDTAGNYLTHAAPLGGGQSMGARAAGGRFPDKGLAVVNGPGSLPLLSIADI